MSYVTSNQPNGTPTWVDLGIPDLERALQDGYSGYGGMGLGLPGSRRLMDEFEVTSEVDKGTTVTMTKWRRDA